MPIVEKNKDLIILLDHQCFNLNLSNKSRRNKCFRNLQTIQESAEDYKLKEGVDKLICNPSSNWVRLTVKFYFWLIQAY